VKKVGSLFYKGGPPAGGKGKGEIKRSIKKREPPGGLNLRVEKKETSFIMGAGTRKGKGQDSLERRVPFFLSIGGGDHSLGKNENPKKKGGGNGTICLACKRRERGLVREISPGKEKGRVLSVKF